MVDQVVVKEETAVVVEEATDAVVVAPRRRRWPWLLAIVVAAAAAIGFAVTRDGSATTEDEPADTLSFGEVVRTDLIELTTYSGTLGRVAGDPVTSSLSGTITASAEPGDVATQGDVLFEVDGEPVVLLFGESPAFRSIASSEGLVAVSSGANGTLTDVVDTGVILEQGDTAFIVGDQPTVLLYGATPMWRTLREDVDEGPDVQQLEQALTDLGYNPGNVTVDEDFTANTEDMVQSWEEDLGIEDDGIVSLGDIVFLQGPSEVMTVAAAVGQAIGSGQTVLQVGDGEPTSGGDVAQLEQALTDLGYDPGAVDGVYTAATRIAVLEWQAAIGAEEDGVVDLGEIVFAESAIRISDLLATVGGVVNPGSPVLAATGSEIVVTTNLPASDQGLVAEGDAVTVELPDNTRTPGTVETVATIASISQAGEAVFEITIVLDDPEAAAGLDEAPVDVDVVTDRVDNTLAVPVTALVALAEGGYAVEVSDGGGGTRLVGVDPGFYADGLVEVGTDSLSVGDRVVVP